MDFKDDVVLGSHDGSGRIAIKEGKIKDRTLNVYHGKGGKEKGISVQDKNLGSLVNMEIVRFAER